MRKPVQVLRGPAFVAEFRDLADPEAELAVIVNPVGTSPRVRWSGSGPWASRAVRCRRVWFQAPDRLRVEVIRRGRLVRVGIRSGNRWACWDPVRGVSRGHAAGSPHLDRAIPPFLDPALIAPERLLSELRLEPAGEAVRVGRPVLCVKAWPRRPLGTGSEVHYAIEIDAEYGIPLKHATHRASRCVLVTEAQKVAYGIALDGTRFDDTTIGYPPGGIIEARSERWSEFWPATASVRTL